MSEAGGHSRATEQLCLLVSCSNLPLWGREEREGCRCGVRELVPSSRGDKSKREPSHFLLEFTLLNLRQAYPVLSAVT